MTAISTIPNLGPATEAQFMAAGIPTAEALRALGADAAYAKALQSGVRPHFIAYYVLVMALQGRPWNDCKGAEKAALRQRFDALKLAHSDGGRTELERFLDQIGVRAPSARKST